MLCEQFAMQMQKEKSKYQNQDNKIDLGKINEINELANKIGVEKMHYEHPGQAAWRRRWDDAPINNINIQIYMGN